MTPTNTETTLCGQCCFWQSAGPSVLSPGTGCFAIGFLAAISDPSFGRTWLKTGWRDFLMVGFCGGYTTFSSYGLQTLNLARDNEWFHVAGNIIGSNALGLLGVYLGWVLGRFVQAKFHGGAL